MKTAEAWIAVLNDNRQSWTVTVRQIQADALRYAANLSGLSHRTYILARADELDPPKTQSCPSCSHQK
jgi:hypothetical protein